MTSLAMAGPAAVWWIVAGILVACELATGTFYLLMLAIGAVAAAIAAHLSAGVIAQVLSAAVIGGGSVGALVIARRRRAPEPASGRNRAVNIDIGNRVEVAQWEPNATAQVMYRGANWHARHEGHGAPLPGEFEIRALDGNVLVLGAVRSTVLQQ